MKKKKQILILMLAALCIFLMSFAVSASEVQAAGLNKKSLSLNVKSTYNLKVSTSSKVKWSSTKKTVASVNSKGKVTAKKKGTAYINAKAGKKTYKCKVKVFSAKLNAANKTITEGTSTTLKVTGAKASKWKSSNPSVATVSSKGKVTGKAGGTCKIYAYVGDSQLTCKITVKSKPISLQSKNTAIEKLRAVYPLASRKAEGKEYIWNLTLSETEAIRNEIYKDIGVSNVFKPQYNCWLLANYICKNIRYTDLNEASWFMADVGTGFNDLSATEIAVRSIYSLYLGEGVCANYAQVTKWLLSGLGIPNYLAESSTHIWSQVLIDGEWYNLDTTWGDLDAYAEINGAVYYMEPDQFLVTDRLHDKLDDINSFKGNKCSSTRFIGYLYTKKQPKDDVFYNSWEIGGVTYYWLGDNLDYWLTDKWKKL